MTVQNGNTIDDYLTAKEAAAILGLSSEAVRRRHKQLGARKRGNQWFFPRAAIEQYKRMVAGKSKHDPTRGQEL